jgi:hypothetical protein
MPFGGMKRRLLNSILDYEGIDNQGYSDNLLYHHRPAFWGPDDIGPGAIRNCGRLNL